MCHFLVKHIKLFVEMSAEFLAVIPSTGKVHIPMATVMGFSILQNLIAQTITSNFLYSTKNIKKPNTRMGRSTHNKPQQSLPSVAWTAKVTQIFGMASPFYAKNSLHSVCHCAGRYALSETVDEN